MLQKYVCPEGSVCVESRVISILRTNYCECSHQKSTKEACKKSKRLLVGWILLKGMIDQFVSPPLRPHFHVWHAAAIVASCIPHPLLPSPLVCCSRGCRASTSVAAAVVYSRLPLLLPLARRSCLRLSAIAAPLVATVNEVVRFHGHHGRGRRRPREHPVLASKSPAWRSHHPLVFIATVYLLPPLPLSWLILASHHDPIFPSHSPPTYLFPRAPSSYRG